mmetsp:Transcript_1522/g.4639  ORF Transcript_1522/g.4639 Transcript_1522/m.4639 type:complete len:329 (+) Transcript_1522:98-1084(+)
MQYLTVPALVSLLIVGAGSSCSVHCSKDQAQTAVNYANGNGMVSIAPMHTNNTTSQTCPSFSPTVEGFLISHRLAYTFASFTVLNFISNWSKAKVLAVPWAKHLSPANLDDTMAAQTRVYLTPLLLLGFLAELYRWLTGCSLAGTYVLTCASWSGVADAWEWIRRWPLSWDLVLHHVGVLSLGVAIVEFQVLPAGGGEWSSACVLFFANLGLQWIGDFVLRSSFLAHELKTMERYRTVALWSAVPRAINMILLVWIAQDAYQAQAWLAVAMTIPMDVGYVAANVDVIYWAYCFKPAEYFAKHQQLWLAAEAPAAVPEGAGGAAQMLAR